MAKKISAKKILVLLIVVNLVVGWFIAPDFGRTVDETTEGDTALAALRAYTPGSIGKYSDNEIATLDRYYGTGLTMMAQAVEMIFQPLRKFCDFVRTMLSRQRKTSSRMSSGTGISW